MATDPTQNTDLPADADAATIQTSSMAKNAADKAQGYAILAKALAEEAAADSKLAEAREAARQAHAATIEAEKQAGISAAELQALMGTPGAATTPAPAPSDTSSDITK